MTARPRSAFQYNSAVWGLGNIDQHEKTLAGRKLDYCLQALHHTTGSVLEVGCARGQFIRSVKRYRPELDAHGCDINARAILLNHQHPDGVTYVVGDGLALPYPDAQFDAVLFFDLLEHIAEPALLLREIHRVLKPGGVVHGYIPCEGQLGTLHWLAWKLRLGHELKRRHRGHIQRFTLQEPVRLMQQLGFEITEVKRSGFLIEQALDLAFYMMLEFDSVAPVIWKAYFKRLGESELSGNGVGLDLLNKLRDIAFALGYYETRYLRALSLALGLHVTARKPVG